MRLLEEMVMLWRQGKGDGGLMPGLDCAMRVAMGGLYLQRLAQRSDTLAIALGAAKVGTAGVDHSAQTCQSHLRRKQVLVTIHSLPAVTLLHSTLRAAYCSPYRCPRPPLTRSIPSLRLMSSLLSTYGLASAQTPAVLNTNQSLFRYM